MDQNHSKRKPNSCKLCCGKNKQKKVDETKYAQATSSSTGGSYHIEIWEESDVSFQTRSQQNCGDNGSERKCDPRIKMQANSVHFGDLYVIHEPRFPNHYESSHSTNSSTKRTGNAEPEDSSLSGCNDSVNDLNTQVTNETQEFKSDATVFHMSDPAFDVSTSNEQITKEEENVAVFIGGQMIGHKPELFSEVLSSPTNLELKSKAERCWSAYQNLKNKRGISRKKLLSFAQEFYASVWLFYFASITDFEFHLKEVLNNGSKNILNLTFGFCNNQVQNSMKRFFGDGTDVESKIDLIPNAIHDYAKQNENDDALLQRACDWVKFADNQDFNKKVFDALHNKIKGDAQQFKRLVDPAYMNKAKKELQNSTKEEIQMSLKYHVDYRNTVEKGTHGAIIAIGERLSDKKKVAVKSVDTNFYRKPQHEELILNECDCDNIVQFYGIFQLDHFTNFFLELCGGDVRKWVDCKNGKDKKPIDVETGKYLQDSNFLEHFLNITSQDIILQSLNGLAYLHKLNIIHRDIKPENFLLKKRNDGKVCVKVTDFGLSRKIKDGQSGYDTEGAGTESYRAPECYGDNVKVKLSSDIFSFGVYTFYVLTLGKYMYGDNVHCHKGNIIQDEKETTVRFAHLLQDKPDTKCLNKVQRITACDSIKKMVRRSANKRPQIEVVEQHPAYWGVKKTLKFFQDIGEILASKEKKQKGKQFLTAFNMYNEEYLQDTQYTDKEKKVKFDVTNALPKCKAGIPVDKKCTGIEVIIRTMRNKLVHAKTLPLNEQKGFGLEADKEDFDFFLELFLEKVPYLLIHCYDFFRETKELAEYYPQSSTEM